MAIVLICLIIAHFTKSSLLLKVSIAPMMINMVYHVSISHWLCVVWSIVLAGKSICASNNASSVFYGKTVLGGRKKWIF
jgi:hypothetical protein